MKIPCPDYIVSAFVPISLILHSQSAFGKMVCSYLFFKRSRVKVITDNAKLFLYFLYLGHTSHKHSFRVKGVRWPKSKYQINCESHSRSLQNSVLYQKLLFWLYLIQIKPNEYSQVNSNDFELKFYASRNFRSHRLRSQQNPKNFFPLVSSFQAGSLR